MEVVLRVSWDFDNLILKLKSGGMTGDVDIKTGLFRGL